MWCFFICLFVNVLCSPLQPLVNEVHQTSQLTSDLVSQPDFVKTLIQNQTLLTEFVKADPDVVQQILGLLNSLLATSNTASAAFTKDVNDALLVKNSKATALTTAITNRDAAEAARVTAQQEFDAASTVHATKVQELNAKQPGVNAESATIQSAIDLIKTLAAAVCDVTQCSYTIYRDCPNQDACGSGCEYLASLNDKPSCGWNPCDAGTAATGDWQNICGGIDALEIFGPCSAKISIGSSGSSEQSTVYPSGFTGVWKTYGDSGQHLGDNVRSIKLSCA